MSTIRPAARAAALVLAIVVALVAPGRPAAAAPSEHGSFEVTGHDGPDCEFTIIDGGDSAEPAVYRVRLIGATTSDATYVVAPGESLDVFVGDQPFDGPAGQLLVERVDALEQVVDWFAAPVVFDDCRHAGAEGVLEVSVTSDGVPDDTLVTVEWRYCDPNPWMTFVAAEEPPFGFQDALGVGKICLRVVPIPGVEATYTPDDSVELAHGEFESVAIHLTAVATTTTSTSVPTTVPPTVPTTVPPTTLAPTTSTTLAPTTSTTALPSTSTTALPSTTTTATSAAVPVAIAGVEAASEDRRATRAALPRTGASTGHLVATGLGAVLVGDVVLTASKVRRAAAVRDQRPE